ncbi:MAG: hypothetical protein WCV86_05465 [Patescibacteria group bacterium]
MAEVKVKKSLVYYLIFAAHVVFILSWLTSPFWLPWPLLLLLSVVLYLQSKYLNYCVMTRWQFGSADVSFWVYYLGKLGIKIKKHQVTDYTMKFFVISMVVAVVWQTLVW